MSKWKELINAFHYIPRLFNLIWETDKMYLVFMVCETLAFAVMEYPAVILSKYALDAMTKGSEYRVYALICSMLVLLGFSINTLKSKLNDIRPARTYLVRGKLYNAFHKKCMEIDYELLAEKEIQELQTFAGEFIQFKLSGTLCPCFPQ